MNAHPQVAALRAGPVEMLTLPPPLEADALNLPVTPNRAAPFNDNAPTVDRQPAAKPGQPARSRWRLPAIAVSALLHAFAAWAIGDRLMRGPVEADDPDAIAVELVVAPPAPQLPPVSVSPGGAHAEAGLDASAESPPVALPPVREFDPSLALAPPPVSAPPEQPVVAPPPPAGALAILAAPPEITPERAPVSAPVPEPRPAAAPAPRREAAKSKAKAEDRPSPQKKTEAATGKTKAGDRKPAGTGKADKPARAAPAGNGGKSSGSAQQSAGSSAAAKAAYGARLLSHVQRFKRYPAAAGGVTGTTRLTVTIGRDGALRGVRVAAGSGNAALDAEARATARRAAPYPRPPDGIGGATITFAVALKFSR